MPNLLINGDFEQGNSGFSTTYNYDQPNGTIFTNVSQYSVISNPSTAFRNPYFSFGDHTTGSGQMLFIDGTSGSSFWSETIGLAANTSYGFSYYVASPEASDPSSPIIQISLNGTALGTGVTVPTTSGPAPTWQQVTQIFTTTAAGNYTLSLADLNGSPGGNDAVLDDFSLQLTTLPPDLVITTAFLNKNSATPGDIVNVSYQVANHGAGNAAASTSNIYLSTDSTVTSSDTLIGTLNDGALAAGTSISETLNVTLASNLAPGTYYIGVVADANGGVAESSETNNTSAALQFTVASPVSPAPTVALALIAGDDVINQAEASAGVLVSGATTNVADGGTVTVVLHGAGGAVLDSETATVTATAFSVTLPSTALHDGIATITADVTTAGGNAPEASRTVTLDLTPPVVSLVQENATASNGQVQVQLIGFVEANAGTRVEIFDGAADLGPATISPQTTSAGHGWSFSTNYAGGSHSLHALATDAAGNTSISAVAPSISGDTATFAFAFAAAHVSPYTGGVQVGSPDNGLTTNLTGINRFVFTDGTQTPIADGSVTHDPHSLGGAVYALYDGLLGRAADPLGLESWVAALQTGTSLNAVAGGFLGSAEGQARAGAVDNATFVDQLYQANLHRQADPDGRAGWIGALDHGASRSDVALGFALSPEHLGNLRSTFDAGIFVPDHNASDVARLYYGLLHRSPDNAGLQSYTDAVAHGTSLHEVAQAFLGSSEYQSVSTGYTNAQYVESAYQHILGRPGDSDGARNWTAALDHGMSRGSVANAFTDSFEFQSHYAGQGNAIYVEALYEAVLGRPGDTAGAGGWVQTLDDHSLTRTDLAHIFTGSAEFQQTYVSPGNGAYVDSLYVNALSRHADAGGLQGWTDALAHGTSRADVATGIAESFEAQQHLLPRIEQGWHLA